MNMPHCTLSVIVCTYNRAALLEKCLRSLFEQQRVDVEFEIIVVDNNSNDGTRSVVEECAGKTKGLRHVFEPLQGISNARNRGWQESRGDYLIYLDDDATVPPEYLSNVLSVIRNYSPDIMGGPIYPYYSSPKPRWFRDEYEIRKYEDHSGFSTKCGVSGSNYVIRRNILEKFGLFDIRFGMRYGTMGMMEERKVVELYRTRVPVDEQKVFYSLECYVLHDTPARKMKLSYMMKRSMVSAYAEFFLILDVEGHPDHRKGILNFIYGLYGPVRKIFVQIYREGWKEVDFSRTLIDGLMKLCRSLGYLWAQSKYLLGFRL
jgi:glucosyl-dolichyl phosphate glucuronosyltransferase